METADFLIIGGGIAGLSAGAQLAAHGRVVVLEGEAALGYHSSGRSATFAHFGIGDAVVRGLTAASRDFFENPPDGFADAALCEATPALFIADRSMLPRLATLRDEMRRFSSHVADADEATMRALCPVLRFGDDAVVAGVTDHAGRKLDGDALLQGYARTIRRRGGTIQLDSRVAAIDRAGAGWAVTTSGDRIVAPILINAAGAWADAVACLAGVAPLGLTPLRRTIVAIDPPDDIDSRSWPFIKTAVDDFYMIPSGGRILASPVDETPSEPTDAQPDDYDIALAADRVEHWTTLPVRRIAHRWAGLRTFTHDRVPTAGFAPDAPGFFWLAGQGGYGLQTAPAMAAAVEALVTGSAWPEALAAHAVAAAALSPGR